MKSITVYQPEDFRDWLTKHHGTERRVAVVVYKRHTGKPTPTHRELINEAICYGWIDTTIKRLDDDRYIRHFARRTKNSTWSDNTLSYARQLIREGCMQPMGLKFYKLGKARPTHNAGIPKNPSMPKKLREILAKRPKAKARVASFLPSDKKMLCRWILSAKLPETKKKRIEKVVRGAHKSARDIILNK